MDSGDHFLELAQTLGAVGGVARIRREEADRIVAPVVGKALLQQLAVIDEAVYWQQLNRRDPERADVIDDCFLAEAGIGAPQCFRYLWVLLCKALDMGLIEDRVIPADRVAVGSRNQDRPRRSQA